MRASMFTLALVALCLPAAAGPKEVREYAVFKQDIEMAQFIVHSAWLPKCPDVIINKRLEKITGQIFYSRGANVRHDAFEGRYNAEIAMSQRRTPAERCAVAVLFLKPYGIIEPY